MEEKEASKKYVIILGIAAIIVIIAIGLFFLLSYTKTCQDKSCFDSYLEKCKRASFIQDSNDSTWKYSIIGTKDNSCLVNVELLLVKEGNIEMAKLQGLDMDCSLPISYIGSPKEDLSVCHGLLKEQMQEMIIEKMHAYIIKNVGKISEEISKL